MFNSFFNKCLFFSFGLILICLSISPASFGQEAKEEVSETEANFSAFLFKGRSQRGGPDYNTLEPFQQGLMGLFDVTSKYGTVFLGGDFSEVTFKKFACDPIVNQMTKGTEKLAPVSDGNFFTPGKFNKIADLEGYYYFKNNNFLPGLMANAEIWMKMEAHQTSKTSEKNCLLVKFLIPEKLNGTIKNVVYVLKADGKIKPYNGENDTEFVSRKEFPNYWIVPLNDPNGTSHLSGQGFSILGSFVKQANCKNLWGLIYPISSQGAHVKSVFFRKVTEGFPLNF